MSTSCNHKEQLNANILICDDDEDTRIIIGHTLLSAGYEFTEAVDGNDAVTQCRKELPDLIILDVMMPGMSGMEFVRWLRQEVTDRFIPVLMLTSLSQVENKIEGLHEGADDYMSKPFHSKELQARVQALLRTRKLTETLRERSETLEALNQELSATQADLLSKERQLAVLQLAGAAAHNLRQPITTILLHCHVLEGLTKKLRNIESIPEEMGAQVVSIQKECRYINSVLEKMVNIDAAHTESYVEGIDILGLEPKKEDNLT